MIGRVIFLLEEPSMKALLDDLIPRLFPGLVVLEHFQCVPHEGKSDLDRSFPRKLRGWREPDVRFVIVRDNDGGNCVELKARLRKLCTEAGRPDSLIRLVCQELESWYIGDLRALAAAYPDDKIDTPAMQKRFIEPDAWQKPSVEVLRLAPSFQKISGARAISTKLAPNGNQSKSFQVFTLGVRRVLLEMGYEPAQM